jgi:hypothetical protein
VKVSYYCKNVLYAILQLQGTKIFSLCSEHLQDYWFLSIAIWLFIASLKLIRIFWIFSAQLFILQWVKICSLLINLDGTLFSMLSSLEFFYLWDKLLNSFEGKLYHFPPRLYWWDFHSLWRYNFQIYEFFNFRSWFNYLPYSLNLYLIV